MTFTVGRDGLRRDGRPFVVAGVTYHPSVAGCRIWLDWAPETIDDDLRRIAASGLNTVRVFLFWRDLQPRPDGVDERVLARVREFVRLAERHGLACLLSVCTIWMNGQRLDLPWRRGRSLWRDAELLDQAERYVRQVARAVADEPNVLALDLGDEIGNVDPIEAEALSRADVVAWQTRLADAARTEFPGVLVTQANDVSGVLGAAAFGPDNGAGLDLLAVHGWPLWSPGAIESTRSVKASQLASFLVRYARAYGPVLLDEIGGYGTADEILAGYLRTASASALAAGALGAVVWCWQDIAARTEPYQERPGERRAGLVRLDGTPKATLPAWQGTAALASALAGFRPDPPDVALYLPERVRARATSYLDAPLGTIAAFYAHLLLQRASLRYAAVAGDQDADLSRYRLVVVAATARLTLADRDRLRRYVTAGGTLYISVADHVHGWPDEDLAGVLPVDFSLLTDGARELVWAADRWPLTWDIPQARRVEVRTDTARVLARFGDGSPAVTVNRAGAGQVIVCCAPVELMLNHPGRLDEAPWQVFYRRIAELAGLPPRDGTEIDASTGIAASTREDATTSAADATSAAAGETRTGAAPASTGAGGTRSSATPASTGAPPPDLEVVSGWRGADRITVLINHSDAPVPPPGYASAEPVPAKGWLLLENGRCVRRCPEPDPPVS